MLLQTVAAEMGKRMKSKELRSAAQLLAISIWSLTIEFAVPHSVSFLLFLILTLKGGTSHVTNTVLMKGRLNLLQLVWLVEALLGLCSWAVCK